MPKKKNCLDFGLWCDIVFKYKNLTNAEKFMDKFEIYPNVNDQNQSSFAYIQQQ